MSEGRCEHVRERIPDLVAGRLEPHEVGSVVEHIERCADCAAERSVVELLHAARPSVPEGVGERIRAGLAAGNPAARRPGTRSPSSGRSTLPWWGLAAAAVAAVALGIGVQLQGPGPAGVSGPAVPGYVAEEDGGEVWLSGDGEVAGAPVLDGLSDEELLLFLEELETGGSA